MKRTEHHIRVSPLFLVVAAIGLLTVISTLAVAYSSLQVQPQQLDGSQASPKVYLVHRLTDADILDRPNVGSGSPAHPHGAVLDAYYLHRLDIEAAGPDRLDGILMDDPRLFAAICRTV